MKPPLPVIAFIATRGVSKPRITAGLRHR